MSSPTPLLLDDVTSDKALAAKPNVADAKFDKDIRIAVLWVELVVGNIGGFGVCLWLWYNRKRKSRVNALIMHVVISDLLVIDGASLSQLIWEYDRTWRAGDVFCKILKFFQSFCLIASTNMIVVLSLDRHQAIRSPLREPPAVWKMTLVGWLIAALFSIPQIAVFYENYVTADGIFRNMTVCESIFRIRPIWVRQTYLTFISLVVFYIPFVILITCYARIFLKIRRKVKESKETNITTKSGHVHLQSTGGTSLTKAKIKTLKMSLVIVGAFVICGFPYHVLELIYNFGDHTSVPGTVSAILGGMAVANSAINPYIFLLFSSNKQCLQTLLIHLPCVRKQIFKSYESTHTDHSKQDYSRSAVDIPMEPKAGRNTTYSMLSAIDN